MQKSLFTVCRQDAFWSIMTAGSLPAMSVGMFVMLSRFLGYIKLFYFDLERRIISEML